MKLNIQTIGTSLREGSDSLVNYDSLIEDMNVIRSYYVSPDTDINSVPPDISDYIKSGSEDLIEFARIYFQLLLGLDRELTTTIIESPTKLVRFSCSTKN